MNGEITMGKWIRAYCKCGFNDELMIGYGFSGPDFCYVPSYCPNCKDLNVVNIISQDRECKQCGSKVLIYGRSKKISNRRTDLTNLPSNKSTGHLCPKCQEFSLIFEFNGMWD